MKGDFSRFTFDKYKNYMGLLRQQGHVLLDSDWNEQSLLWIENYRQLAADILGEFAIPISPNEITRDNSSALKISKFTMDSAGIPDFKISRGKAYIAGYLFILRKDTSFRNQPDYPEPDAPGIDGDIIVYLEAWLKTINYIDDDFIREPILGGPDTCLRAKLIGQVRAVSAGKIADPQEAADFIRKTYPENMATLSIKFDHSGRQIPLSFGEIEPKGGYSVQNLHLRLELHRGTTSNGGLSEGVKWSDENCATVVPILEIKSPNSIIIDEPEAISGSFFSIGDWVEIGNAVTELHRQGGQLTTIIKIKQIDSGHLIELDSEIHPLLTRRGSGARSGSGFDPAPRVRRWSGYASPLTFDKSINVGKGIKAIFYGPGKSPDIVPGDFWTFAIRDRDYNRKYAPQKASPDGVKVYRSPLAIIKRTGRDKFDEIIDCRKFFKPLASLEL
jgi:hypothetical protein